MMLAGKAGKGLSVHDSSGSLIFLGIRNHMEVDVWLRRGRLLEFPTCPTKVL